MPTMFLTRPSGVSYVVACVCVFWFHHIGKQYSWCLCGKSKSQPICDGMHKNVHYKIKLR